MRVTSEMNYRMLSDSIQRQQATLQHYLQKLASGREVSKASDDPGAFGQIRHLASDGAQLQQYMRNAEMARQYTTTADQGLSQVIDIMHRINELSVQSGDGTLTSRDALIEEVDTLLESMLSLANGSDGGRYTFAGLRTDTPPYETVLDPIDGRIVAVHYVGSEETRTIKIGDLTVVPTNCPGSTSTSEGGVFQTATRDIFDTIIQLRETMEAGQDVTTSAIPSRLQADLDHLLNTVSLNGAREEQIKMNQTYLIDRQSANLTSRDDLESIDLASAMIKLSAAETAYQAALGSASRMLQQVSLMNFI